MKEQFQHTLMNSLFLWFDNYLLKYGEAFTNATGVCTNYNDPHLNPIYQPYGSQFKQWVSDSSIGGASIPSGVYINGNFSGRNDGVVVDFENGRVLLDTNNTSLNVTGSFAYKDFNIYFTNENEEDLIIENKFKVNSRIPSPNIDYIDPYDQVVPAIFLSTNTMTNKGFAFGGMEETTVFANAIILAENMFQLDGVLSIFADSKNEVITPIPMSGFPITEYGDVKNGLYSYESLKSEFSDLNGYYIYRVTTSKLTDTARKKLQHDLYIGFIDFEIQQHRYRHQ